MADNRSRRQKLEAVIAPNSGATDGERANARSLLKKMKPETAPPPRPMAPPMGQSPFGAYARYREYGRYSGQFSGPSWEEIREHIRRTDSTFEDLLRNYMGGWGDPFNQAPEKKEQSQLCNRVGHNWVVLAKTVYQTDIKRCTRCGVYDPARKPRVVFEKEEG